MIDIYEEVKLMADEKEISVLRDTNLFESGILDSLNIVRLITILADKYNVDIPFEELDVNIFESIDSINKFIN